MKKVTVIIASLVILASVSCKEQNEEPQVVEKTETVVIEKEKQPEENDGTSLSISNDGVEFSTKDGEKKTEVDIDTENK
ncbi:MAG: hypothetical protein CMP76_09895 [Flavobacterium sp.]|uniref:Uncharacterized protein n=1 Tax=Flavobacterium profundi TaxID=1774945 RepID=A0A6I4ISX7_9FLAO|nr:MULTISPECIES: hypothetical protein [Flavobacterium]MBF03595.1 hypothetical protein [Flavobacterium sp.]MCO6162987.1 hypothetical protein [Flavobacterium sp. NRK F7]MVO09959.1 hypothetical protein [Flavobacterium profundi]|tara:strand:+ start:506 stop:742 length:237 start_codon:yes stop_codon:yes gene_type:complete